VSWFESSRRHERSRGPTVRAALFQGANTGSIRSWCDKQYSCRMRVVLAQWALVSVACAKGAGNPEIVVVHDGPVVLHAMLWRPDGPGPFPAVLFNHGSGRTKEELVRLGPYEDQAATLGRVFARHGYVFLFLFRQGVGLSADQGASAIDLMNHEGEVDARNAIQLSLLEQRELSAAMAGWISCADAATSIHDDSRWSGIRSADRSRSCRQHESRMLGPS
jgi:hypothetical protein